MDHDFEKQRIIEHLNRQPVHTDAEMDAELMHIIKKDLADNPDNLGVPQVRYLLQKVDELQKALDLSQRVLFRTAARNPLLAQMEYKEGHSG